jgi:hypothetical protein
MTPNPYQSPTDGGKGRYDWSTATRIFIAAALLAIWYLLIGAVGAWQGFRNDCNHRHEPIVNTLIEFAVNWKDGNGTE